MHALKHGGVMCLSNEKMVGIFFLASIVGIFQISIITYQSEKKVNLKLKKSSQRCQNSRGNMVYILGSLVVYNEWPRVLWNHNHVEKNLRIKLRT
jgi:hypothetical protein